MNQKTKIIGVVIGLIVVAGGGYAVWSRSSGGSAEPFSLSNLFSSPAPAVPEQAPPPPEDTASQPGRYENTDVGFSFSYPPEFTVNEFNDDKGYTILAENSAKKSAFQVFLYPFDEEGPITAARIRKDMPNLAIQSPQEVMIGANKDIRALIFYSEEKTLGRTREVWFVAGGYLFQVETFADQDALIGPIMDSFKFE